jgi:hypothetical protein
MFKPDFDKNTNIKVLKLKQKAHFKWAFCFMDNLNYLVSLIVAGLTELS